MTLALKSSLEKDGALLRLWLTRPKANIVDADHEVAVFLLEFLDHGTLCRFGGPRRSVGPADRPRLVRRHDHALGDSLSGDVPDRVDDR